jgi:hypothetical protein
VSIRFKNLYWFLLRVKSIFELNSKQISAHPLQLVWQHHISLKNSSIQSTSLFWSRFDIFLKKRFLPIILTPENDQMKSKLVHEHINWKACNISTWNFNAKIELNLSMKKMGQNMLQMFTYYNNEPIEQRKADSLSKRTSTLK